MVFNSLTFVLFFIIILILHNLPFPWQVKKFNLLIASYVFYAAWSPPFVILLWVATIIDWFVAQWLAKTENEKKRKRILLISIFANLGMLSYFKYGNFLINNFVGLVNAVGFDYHPPAPNIILPIGISFYTFVTLSYTIDVYRRKIEPAKSFLDYALLITFFPHLVSGPILRASQFLPQCLEPKKANSQQMGWGLALMVFGLFQKVVLADGFLAPVVDKIFWMKGDVSWSQGWLGSFGFAAQVFFDFDGYSICAIGAALCLGFVFPDNFKFPFASIGFSEFWNRWHISLSTWFRDYLYFPLGGSYKGTMRTYFNLAFVMFISGLWHGSAWQYIVWGGMHGVFLVGEQILRRTFSEISIFKTKLFQIFLAFLTFFLFSFSMVLFRGAGLANGVKMYNAMFTGAISEMILYSNAQAICAIVIILGVFIFHWLMRKSSLEEVAAKLPWWVTYFILALMILSIILIPGENHAYVYFQF
ncbi:MAG TPA: MBOAT family O-acyltransferase [Pyrinomonadaceae bacterium]|nr:MBOAT family O-acyltransferase [Pyrinomonadaceae bacterium]